MKGFKANSHLIKQSCTSMKKAICEIFVKQRQPSAKFTQRPSALFLQEDEVLFEVKLIDTSPRINITTRINS